MNLTTEKLYYPKNIIDDKLYIVFRILKSFNCILKREDAVIAGGFARAAYLFLKYNQNNIFNYLKRGDIDIFLMSKKETNYSTINLNKNEIFYELENVIKETNYKAKRNLDILDNPISFEEEATFSKNFYYEYELKNSENCYNFYSQKTQIIKEFQFNSYELLLESFDFNNSRYIMNINFEKCYIEFIFDKDAIKYDLKKEIMICNPVNNLVGYRIAKYLNRGCKTISKDSIGYLQDYIKKLSRNEIEYISGNAFEKEAVLNGTLKLKDPYSNMLTLENLHKFGVMSDVDLLYFLNKWDTFIYKDVNKNLANNKTYSALEVVGKCDWAIAKIQKR